MLQGHLTEQEKNYGNMRVDNELSRITSTNKSLGGSSARRRNTEPYIHPIRLHLTHHSKKNPLKTNLANCVEVGGVRRDVRIMKTYGKRNLSKKSEILEGQPESECNLASSNLSVSEHENMGSSSNINQLNRNLN